MFNNIYKNKKVVITGHTGFKGSWLASWLNKLGADVYGIALEPHTNPSHYEMINLDKTVTSFIIDVRNKSKMSKVLNDIQPDFIFHLAAQALVHQAYEDSLTTWETNLLGTINILEILKNFRHSCSAILITSDKCYENKEWIWGYRENDQMGGIDPYSASKGATEIAIRSYYLSFFYNHQFVKIASARAGNVIGGGDWSDHRIIPDCIKSWSNDISVEIRNPKSTRPWQHVLEPLSGYLKLGYYLNENNNLNGESFNFGPTFFSEYSVEDLVFEMSKFWNKAKIKPSQKSISNIKESSLLKLNCDKAALYLDWKSTLNFTETIEFTALWYKEYFENQNNISEITHYQIDAYSKLSSCIG